MGLKKPNELHVAEGTARADRGTDVIVALPDDLAREPILQNFEREFDRQAVFDHVRAWIINLVGSCSIDELSISLLVDQFEIYSVSKRDVKERGVMLEGEKGQYVNHSLYNMNTSHEKIVAMFKQFGMTPATRGSVKASNQMDRDPLSDILKGPD